MSTWTVPGYADEWAVPGYTAQRELGRGASGRVVEAVSDATGQRVAIKYLSPSLVRDPAFMGGFRTEAPSASRVPGKRRWPARRSRPRRRATAGPS
jgi:serine/threonine protein kinase